MAKFPDPPPVEELAARLPDIRQLASGERLWRVYFRGGSHPTHWNSFRDFGPTAARFDHHREPSRAQDRAVLYAASQVHSCLAEAFQDGRIIDRTARGPWLVAFDLHRPLNLLDLTGAWPTRAGASMAINSGPRPRARRWSRVIYEAYPDLDGLCYASSMYRNAPAFALYERAADAIPEVPAFHRALLDSALLTPLRNACAALGYGLV